MSEIRRQNPDGSWSRAEPLGWQGGLDWEIQRTSSGYRAELLHKAELIAVVKSRWRPVLAVRMALAKRRWRRG